MKRTALLAMLALPPATPVQAITNDVSTVISDIRTEAGLIYGSLSTVYGNIAIESDSTIRRAKTVNGDITIGRGSHTGNVETVNGSIEVSRKAQVQGRVQSDNGHIRLAGGSRVRDNVSTVVGSIDLAGAELDGELETVAGDVTVRAGSHIKGGIKVRRPQGKVNLRRPPRIVIDGDAVIEGPLVFEHEVSLYVHRTAKIGAVTGAVAKPFDTTLGDRGESDSAQALKRAP